MESKSVLKNYSDTSEETTVTIPKDLGLRGKTSKGTNDRSRRSVLEPWIIYDSAERELYKRSAEERDWFLNYKAIQKNLVLPFLRSKRSLNTPNVDDYQETSHTESSGKKLQGKGHVIRRRSADTFTGGIMFDPYMGRF